ncbi:ABC transporter ATP-binding protein [Actinomyces sp. F1_1611]
MSASRLGAQDLATGYGAREVISHLDFAVPDGSFTIIIGPNACGKSTLLRALAHLLPARGGQVLLDGRDVARLPAKELARQVGILPQSPLAPEGITVRRLVSFGRHPYRGLLGGWSGQDQAAVDEALARTHLTELSDRLVDELSGGQRQRVWIALALAQETDLLLLDEPTTYLDLAHQIDILDLCAQLNQAGRTLVAVLHDLNQAVRYATHLVAMRDGKIVAEGRPEEIVNQDLIRDVFGLDTTIIPDPETGRPLVIPCAPPAQQLRR